jgi:hypothetical protein
MSAEKGMVGMHRRRELRKAMLIVTLVVGGCISGWALDAAADDPKGFSIKKAEWKAGDGELRVEGEGTKGATVSLENAVSGAVIWPATVPMTETEWKIRVRSVSPVPCRVRARQSDGSVAERDVKDRPSDCGPVPDNQAPGAPGNLSAAAASSSQIDLSWAASIDNVGVTEYQVERCLGSTCADFARIATSTGTSYSDIGLAAGTDYRYRVRAADAAGNLGAYSNVAGARTRAAVAFEVNKAEWRADNLELRVEGKGTANGTVTVVNAFATSQVLGTVTVDSDGKWRMRPRNPSPVPCRVRVSDGVISLERDVKDRPANCAPAAAGQPGIAINDVTVTEGGTANFTVTLSAVSTQPVTVVAGTADGTAVAPGDYTARTGVTLTFPAGTTTQSFSVATVNDTAVEPTETFTVRLSNPVNATIARGAGTGTITDNDVAPPPALSIGNVSVNEGNTGTATATFTVSLSAAAPAGGVSFNFATANGTATAGSDYVATSGSRTIAAGATTATIAVTINGDTAVEPDETFTVNITGATNTANATASATGTIVNDDQAPPPPAAQTTISISDAQAFEGQSATFTVTLSASPSQQVTVSLATANGTASAGSDYTSRTATLNFSAGTTTLSQTFTVATTADSAAEPNETFAVNLSEASGAAIARTQAIGTILENTQGNVIAIHDRRSALYNSNCTSCHAGMLTEPSLNTAVRSTTAHGTMLKAGNKPGNSGANNQCAFCHRGVYVVEGAPMRENTDMGSLRKHVDPAICALCHGPGSRGRQLYQANLSAVVPDSDGARLYDLACSGCHRPLENSQMRGKSASSIQSAITGNKGQMGALSPLTPAQIQSIANALR